MTSFLKDWDDHGFLPSYRELAEFKTAVEKTCQTFRDSLVLEIVRFLLSTKECSKVEIGLFLVPV